MKVYFHFTLFILSYIFNIVADNSFQLHLSFVHSFVYWITWQVGFIRFKGWFQKYVRLHWRGFILSIISIPRDSIYAYLYIKWMFLIVHFQFNFIFPIQFNTFYLLSKNKGRFQSLSRGSMTNIYVQRWCMIAGFIQYFYCSGFWWLIVDNIVLVIFTSLCHVVILVVVVIVL